MRRIFVTGIGTEVGKTVISAILVESLEADYWKPVQAGDLEKSDSMKVKSHISNLNSTIHQETFRLKHAMSPHAAARLEKRVLDLDQFNVPVTENNLIIEGAGGLMVPLNDNDLMIDLMESLDVEVVLVSRNYLGSINHTVLSTEALQSRNLKILGVVFNGEPNEETEGFILNYSGLKCLGRVNEHEEINQQVILGYKAQFKKI